MPPLLIFRFVRWTLTVVIGTTVLALLGGGALYYWHAVSKLPVDAGAVKVSVARPAAALTGTTLPLTFEAYWKRADAPNWLEGPSDMGLVSARYEWSHARQAWVKDDGFEARQAETAAKRQALARERSDPDLLTLLVDPSAEHRELAAAGLKARAYDLFGYRYEASLEENKPAVDRIAAAVRERRGGGVTAPPPRQPAPAPAPGPQPAPGAGSPLEGLDPLSDAVRRAREGKGP
jgi:hypothetical protein